MNKTITIKGTGKVSAKPDRVSLTMTLEAQALHYDKTMDKAGELLDEVINSIAAAGFERKKLKTTAFNVNTHYENERDERGNYKQVFKGFKCTHSLNLEFDFDTALLTKTVSEIAKCSAAPHFSINFTAKNKEKLKNTLLKNAVKDAKRKADVLVAALNVQLGGLLTVDYTWSDITFNSATRFNHVRALAADAQAHEMNFEPENIELEDSVTVVWEIAGN